MVERKIFRHISDEVCEDGCPQLWQGACRAYQKPHSDEEREHRQTANAEGRAANCLRTLAGGEVVSA